MDSRHSRLGGTAEWLVALVFLVATVVVAVLIVREMRAVRSIPPALQAPQPTAPAQPADHVMSVLSLLLLDGRQVRVGDTLEQVTAQFGASSQAGTDVVERARLGDRLTRSYEHAGTKFTLVFEPFEQNGPLRITAIYLR